MEKWTNPEVKGAGMTEILRDMLKFEVLIDIRDLLSQIEGKLP